VGIAWLCKQVAKAGVWCGSVAMRHVARNPYAALRRYDPKGTFHMASNGPVKRQHQLPLSVLMYRNFSNMIIQVHAKSHSRLVDIVKVVKVLKGEVAIHFGIL
jgi:hypothetical protein